MRFLNTHFEPDQPRSHKTLHRDLDARALQMAKLIRERQIAKAAQKLQQEKKDECKK